MPEFYSETENEALEYLRSYVAEHPTNGSTSLKLDIEAFNVLLNTSASHYNHTKEGRSSKLPLFRHTLNQSMFSRQDRHFEIFRQNRPCQYIKPSHNVDTDLGPVVKEPLIFHRSLSPNHGRFSCKDSTHSTAICKGFGNIRKAIKNTKPPWEPVNHPSVTRFDDLYATSNSTYDTDLALAEMHTAFSKWSYRQREGIDAIPAAVMNVPENFHAKLNDMDEANWMKIPKILPADLDATESTIHSQYEDGTDSSPNSTILCTPPTPQAKKYPSKRAELIAKSQAANARSVPPNSSATTKLSLRYKNKTRKSIVPDRKPPTKTTQAKALSKENPKRWLDGARVADHDEALEPAVRVAFLNGSFSYDDEHDSKTLYQAVQNNREALMAILRKAKRWKEVEEMGENAEAEDRLDS